MRIQASIEFMLIASAVAALALFAVTFYSKNLFSQSSALAQVADSFPNSSYFYQPFNFSYTSATTTIGQSYYSVAITNRSEELAYSIGSPSYVVNMSEFSHCAYHGFFGHLLNVSGQCGTGNAWDYLASYDCATSGAYCILPHTTSYAVDPLSSRGNYLYSFTLVINSPLGTLYTNLNGSANRSSVFLSNGVVGYASVLNVSGVQGVEASGLFSNSSSYYTLNQMLYGQYSQMKNVLYPMLAFYNGTSVDPGTQESIQQTFNAFTSSSNKLIAGKALPLPCNVSGNEYLCETSYPFYYIINVSLSKQFGNVNQTFYYLGSLINIRTG